MLLDDLLKTYQTFMQGALTAQNEVLTIAREVIAGAREGLWLMRNDPGVAYLCGPMALKSLAEDSHAPDKTLEALDAYRSGPRGVSLTEVGALANDRNGSKLANRVGLDDGGAICPRRLERRPGERRAGKQGLSEKRPTG
jgi:hypothetical protein